MDDSQTPTPEQEPQEEPSAGGADQAAPGAGQAEAPPTIEATDDDRTMGMLCHLLGIFTGFIGPLIIWLIKKDQSAFVDDQGKEALNFQITLFLAMIVSGVLMIICIGYFLALAAYVCDILFCIMGTIAANKGELYRYPVNIRFVK